MTTLGIVMLVCFGLALIIYIIDCGISAKRTAEAKRNGKPVRVYHMPLPPGKTIYELFPEWENEIAEKLDENAAFCNLYLAANEIIKHGISHRNMTELSNQVENCKRHFI